MKKIVAFLMLCCSFLFADINLQTASKEELMGIKGLVLKKLNKLSSIEKQIL